MNDAITVARHDWLHGLVPCPGCGLPRAPDRDHVSSLRRPGESQAYGVEGKHQRCGATFRLEFDDARGRGR